MMHFFRSSKIHLDVFTDQAYAMEATPVDYASKYMPDWWKQLPKSRLDEDALNSVKTMKHCVGMIDFYRKSFCLPMWSDIAVSSDDGRYRWQYADGLSRATYHPTMQYEGFIPKSHQHLKLDSPWIIKCKQDTSFVASQATYSHGQNITNYALLPGVVNFKHQIFTNIQLVFDSTKNKVFMIKRGTPMYMYTPMSDKKVILHRHLVSKAQLNSIVSEGVNASFSRSYLTAARLKEKFGCPFKDHTK